MSSFSALQRAENSSIVRQVVNLQVSESFSALQRAENSSISLAIVFASGEPFVSVLFSEPKIPQFYNLGGYEPGQGSVSVLFSEPKIPQFERA